MLSMTSSMLGSSSKLYCTGLLGRLDASGSNLGFWLSQRLSSKAACTHTTLNLAWNNLILEIADRTAWDHASLQHDAGAHITRQGPTNHYMFQIVQPHAKEPKQYMVHTKTVPKCQPTHYFRLMVQTAVAGNSARDAETKSTLKDRKPRTRQPSSTRDNVCQPD